MSNIQINTTIIIGIIAVLKFNFVLLEREITGKIISATTIGLMPLKMLFSTFESLNAERKTATDKITVKEGRTVAITHKTAPFLPKNRLPINIEIFTAKIPGDI